MWTRASFKAGAFLSETYVTFWELLTLKPPANAADTETHTPSPSIILFSH